MMCFLIFIFVVKVFKELVESKFVCDLDFPWFGASERSEDAGLFELVYDTSGTSESDFHLALE